MPRWYQLNQVSSGTRPKEKCNARQSRHRAGAASRADCLCDRNWWFAQLYQYIGNVGISGMLIIYYMISRRLFSLDWLQPVTSYYDCHQSSLYQIPATPMKTRKQFWRHERRRGVGNDQKYVKLPWYGKQELNGRPVPRGITNINLKRRQRLRRLSW